MNTLLDVDKISVFYGDNQALFDFSLRVGEGEIVTLIGSNGAGKTTTVNTISGILRPKSGNITFAGQSTLKTPPHQLVEQGLVQVPEGRMLFANMTARENLKMGAYAGDARKSLGKKIDWIYELFPRLRERESQLVSTMSGGEQQMVAIGRGLMSSPKLLILDEPSIGLAPLLVEEMFRVIQEINQNNVSVLLIEQNAIQALTASNRGYVMENGHLAREGDAKMLLNDEGIKSAYLGM